MSSPHLNFPSIEHVKESATKRPWNEGNNFQWIIQEKLDGSEISFSRGKEIGEKPRLTYTCGSREIKLPSSAFGKVIPMLNEIAARCSSDRVYHGECVAAPRQSTLTYERVPARYFVLFDVQDKINEGRWLSYKEVEEEAKRLGVESIRTLFDNGNSPIRERDPLRKAREFLHQIEEGTLPSMLGGPTEGIVIKHPNFYRGDKASAFKMKMVSEGFKECHLKKKPKLVSVSSSGRPALKKKGRDVKARLWTPEIVLRWMGSMFNVDARFRKALQHLKERENLEYPTFLQITEELDRDFLKEHLTTVKLYLWQEFSPMLRKEGRSSASKFFENPQEYSEEPWVDCPVETPTQVISWLAAIFNRRSRFIQVNSNVGPFNCLGDFQGALDQDLNGSRDLLVTILWTLFQQPILEASRKGLNEFLNIV